MKLLERFNAILIGFRVHLTFSIGPVGLIIVGEVTSCRFLASICSSFVKVGHFAWLKAAKNS